MLIFVLVKYIQSAEAKYVAFDDGRKLCLKCMESVIMDKNEFQPVYLEVQEFYEGLDMKIEQEFPMILVDLKAMNEAMYGEKLVRQYVKLLNKENVAIYYFVFYYHHHHYFIFGCVGHFFLPLT